MAYTSFTEISEAAGAITEFIYLNQDKLPEHVREALAPPSKFTSPVDLTAAFVKAVYANRDDPGITKEAMLLAAGGADVFDLKGFHGRFDDQAGGMSLALLRDGGEKASSGKAWPKKDADPPVDTAFAKPAEITVTPPPPPQAPPPTEK